MDNFGDWILERLKEKKWRQADLARAANLDTAVISNLINSKRGPGEDTCKAIARALRGLISRVVVDRTGREVVGSVTAFFTP